MASSYTGGCACGAIRYEISAEPIFTAHCQCRDCQRMTGTGHASMMAFPESGITLTGSPKFFRVTAGSGAIASRGFCPNCGSFLMGKSTAAPGVLAVTAASLDDPGRFSPGMVLYTATGYPWDHMDPELPSYPGMPPQATT